MTLFNQINQILLDETKTVDGRYEDLREFTYRGELADQWNNPNWRSTPGMEKEAGIDFLVRNASDFFLTRAIKKEDWGDIRQEMMELAKTFLAGPEKRVDRMQEFRALEQRIFARAKELAESGKYPPEKVSRWFEMGY